MVRTIRSFCFLSFITLGLLLSGCAKYTPHFLGNLSVRAEDKEGVRLAATLLSEDECRHHFSRKIISKGYRPIQLYIFNNSKQGYIFDTLNVNLAIEDRDVVAQALHLNTANRILPYAICGLFLGVLFIPAVVEGAKSYEANKKLDEDFARRVINSQSRIFVAPGAVLNRVMFIRSEDLVSPLVIDLVNKETNEKLNFVVNI